MEAFAGNVQDSIETPFRDLIGDSQNPDFRAGIVVMLHRDNLEPTRGQGLRPTPLERITSKRHP
jgi:hypothetical protein